MNNEPDATVFNPLDKRNLGKSVVDALLEVPPIPLRDIARFSGAGIYAIYYSGNFPAYAKLAALNKTEPRHPIYVGKATPKGGRKGISADASLESTALSQRLLEHKASIEAVPSLKIDDFTCRYLVVDDIWIPLGETLVIQQFHPLWNQVVEGFGNHDPGDGRYSGMRPLWDELHSGRIWAKKCRPNKISREQILGKIKDYINANKF